MLKYADFVAYLAENDGQAEGYLREVDKQWQVAHAEAYRQIEQTELVTNLLQCIHYALVMTSVQSLRAEVGDDYEEQYYAISGILNEKTPNREIVSAYLLEQIVPNLSMFNQILVYIQRARETKDSAEQQTYLDLAESKLVSISDAYQKAYLLPQLIGVFSELIGVPRYHTMLENAIEAVVDPWQQANLYSLLAQLEGYPAQDQAFQLAQEKAFQIEDAYFRASTLGAFIRQQPLTDELKTQFLAEIQATLPLIQSVRPRLQAMYVLYQAASSAKQKEMAEEIIKTVQNDLATEYAQLGVIQYYGRIFTDKHRIQLIRIARGFENKMYQARALAVFLPDVELRYKQTIQRDVLDYLGHLSNRSRSQVLSLFMRRELFSAHVWGEDVSVQITQVIGETCADWLI